MWKQEEEAQDELEVAGEKQKDEEEEEEEQEKEPYVAPKCKHSQPQQFDASPEVTVRVQNICPI